MKRLLAMCVLGTVITLAVPAFAGKVCYHCQKGTPHPYVCARKDTFVARANAKKVGCNWDVIASDCTCGAWVEYKPKRRSPMKSTVQYWLWRFAR